jgi:hypothetical protein
LCPPRVGVGEVIGGESGAARGEWSGTKENVGRPENFRPHERKKPLRVH